MFLGIVSKKKKRQNQEFKDLNAVSFKMLLFPEDLFLYFIENYRDPEGPRL